MQISSAPAWAAMFGVGQTSRANNAYDAGAARMDASLTNETQSGARAELTNFMKMTPAEKMHAAILAQMGVSEEEYQAMSADKRAEIDAKIEEKIKRQAEESALDKGKTGVLADITV
ncbi:MAG: hypothetical protein ABW063_08525 [Caulobacter sp.]